MCFYLQFLFCSASVCCTSATNTNTYIQATTSGRNHLNVLIPGPQDVGIVVIFVLVVRFIYVAALAAAAAAAVAN